MTVAAKHERDEPVARDRQPAGRRRHRSGSEAPRGSIAGSRQGASRPNRSAIPERRSDCSRSGRREPDSLDLSGPGVDRHDVRAGAVIDRAGQAVEEYVRQAIDAEPRLAERPPALIADRRVTRDLVVRLQQARPCPSPRRSRAPIDRGRIASRQRARQVRQPSGHRCNASRVCTAGHCFVWTSDVPMMPSTRTMDSSPLQPITRQRPVARSNESDGADKPSTKCCQTTVRDGSSRTAFRVVPRESDSTTSS